MDARKQTKEVVGFLTTVSAELDEIEKSGIEHCFGTVDEAGLILKAALSYQRQIASMWRRLAVEAADRMLGLLGPSKPVAEEKA